MVKTIAKIIIEILIAMTLFYILARYTKVFDRIFSETQNSQTGQNSIHTTLNTGNNIANNTVKQTKYYDNNGNQITQAEYLKQFDNEADQMIASITSSTKVITKTSKSSCITPRNTKVPHGASVNAYLDSQGEGSNYCKSEKRTCNDGVLGGTYNYNTCNYITSKVSTTNFYVGDTRYTQSKQLFRIPYIAPPKEYVQPTMATDKGKSFRTDGKLANTSNAPKTTIVWNNSTTKMPYKTSGDWLGDIQSIKIQSQSCTTPRGETVKSGEFVYAYKTDIDTSRQESCSFEKRSCQNGVLLGTYQYKSCQNAKNPKYPYVTYYPITSN